MADKQPPISRPLDTYRAKRSVGRTPEPFGAAAIAKSDGAERLFVIQKHAARRLHYDFRLELGGVLKSWAVPKGPSLDPAEKRLAVAVEDHPLDYADFEGAIPEGNYGAGAVIVWDRGSWRPLEDPEQGLRKGKLLFKLHGYKVGGVWTLVRTKRSERDWLLIKKPDAWAASPAAPLGEESVLSGRTLEEVTAGSSPRDEIVGELERLGAPRRKVDPGQVKLMLAETSKRPFSNPDWLFELKYDGFRLLVAREPAGARLLYRRGSDATAIFPEVARATATLPFDRAIMDGEVVVLDERGHPSFQRLQKRVQLRRAPDIARAAVELPATAFLFDLVAFEGFDLRPLPLCERKRLLQRLVPHAGPLRFSDHVEERGEDFCREVERLGLEGLMAKRRLSTYQGRRSADWLKIRLQRTGDFVVVGFTEPKGSRAGLGALHLAVRREDGTLRYAGRAGSGFSDQQLGELRARLEAKRRADPPCDGALPEGKGHVWVEPELVCEVRYTEWTEEGVLRQPVFLRFRDDKRIEDCHDELVPPSLPEPEAEPPAPERTIPFSNLDKVFWPKQRYTKGDLIEFYRSVADWLLPYLRDRPIVLTRYPDGIDGKSFYQKDAPGFVPGWIRTVRVWSEHAGREIDYFVCDDVESLLYIVNLGTIPIHVWSSRVGSLERPDYCIIDLDPKGAPFAHVVEVARAVQRLCEQIALPSFVKTSGATGLHVLIPLAGQCTYEQSRLLGELISRVVEEELPKISTMTRKIDARGGRVYLDYLQNRHGQTIASPFSVRPVPEASVSTPLRWSEVNAKLDPKRFTLRTVPSRLGRLKVDPLREVLELKPDLQFALKKLADTARAGNNP